MWQLPPPASVWHQSLFLVFFGSPKEYLAWVPAAIWCQPPSISFNLLPSGHPLRFRGQCTFGGLCCWSFSEPLWRPAGLGHWTIPRAHWWSWVWEFYLKRLHYWFNFINGNIGLFRFPRFHQSVSVNCIFLTICPFNRYLFNYGYIPFSFLILLFSAFSFS